MKETYIKEFIQIEPNNPILIEGLPGLGLVGKIALRYMIKQLKAKKIAYLYSPHFPYFVLVNKKGNVRLFCRLVIIPNTSTFSRFELRRGGLGAYSIQAAIGRTMQACIANEIATPCPNVISSPGSPQRQVLSFPCTATREKPICFKTSVTSIKCCSERSRSARIKKALRVLGRKSGPAKLIQRLLSPPNKRLPFTVSSMTSQSCPHR